MGMVSYNNIRFVLLEKKEERLYEMKKVALFLKRLWRDRTLVLMVLPAVIMLIMFNYIPMTGLVLAFKKFDYSLGMYDSPWVGFNNFRHLFLVAERFWRITRNTVGYFIVFTIIGTIAQVFLAIAINEMVFKKTAKIVQSILILPTFISYVAVSYIVEALLKYDVGAISRLIANFTGENINFYIQADYWPIILVIINTWKTTGYGSVLYLSVLAGIDQELYEAAALDGANAWQKMRYITIPMLTSMVIIRTLLGLGSIMHSDTGLFYQATKNVGALYKTTEVLDSFVLNAMTTTTDYGVTSAVTFYQSIVGLVMIVGVNAIVRRISPEDALF